MMLSASTVCVSRRLMLDQTRSRLSVRVGVELAVVRDAVREDVRHRDLERDREDVEAGEHVLRRRPARARDAAEVARAQVDEVEDALLVELIRIVELAGDDAAAVRQRLDVTCRRTADRRDRLRGSSGRRSRSP